ncbi:CatB-related O-acetyltransferase [Sulfurimonas sp. NW7]|uniref:CatB-related O-acetyltransferase n=1 Tax=Sulfurimonas sp. NW7 TaxID=2922727 RepID=UPI003DA91790
MQNKVGKKVVISARTRITNSKLKFYSRVKDYAELHSSVLGKYSYVSQYSIVNKTKIGKFCSIANGCYIGLWEHNTDVSTHSFYLYEHSGNFVKGYRNYKKDDIETIIGNDVWIGANVVVKKGIEIGDGAIVGASAVVTKNVPPYAVVVGNPAKVIKYRYNRKDIEWLASLQWWNFSRKKLKTLINKGAFDDFTVFKQLLKDKHI